MVGPLDFLDVPQSEREELERSAGASGNGDNGDAPSPKKRTRKPRAKSAPKKDVLELLTDIANGERFIAQHGDQVRYCPELGEWLVWDELRWVPNSGGTVEAMAKETARSIFLEAMAQTTLERQAMVAKWAVESGKAGRVNAMLTMARSEPDVWLAADVFDADPWLLNVNNGTVDLRTGALRSHLRTDLITKLAPVDYDPEAQSRVLDDYLASSTSSDAALASYVQRALGYSLTGDTTEEVFFLVLGPAGSGKTTLAEAMLTLLGDYAVKASFETFLQARANPGGAQPELARLRGARFVAAVEAPADKKLAEVLVKEISGGDRMTVRHLYREPFTFKPALKLWLAANDSPRISDTDSGIWRRLRRVPFEHSLAEAERDPQVKAHLCSPEGGAALLAWAVAGCLEWQAKGLGTCQVVAHRTAELRADMDPLGEFLALRCLVSPLASVPALTLREEYEGWAKEMGARPINNREWGKRLKALGAKSTRAVHGGHKITVWIGIGLLEASEETGGHNGQDTAPLAAKWSSPAIWGDLSEKGQSPVRPVHSDESDTEAIYGDDERPPF